MTTSRLLPLLFAASLAPASAELISVNFEQYTPGLGTFAVESELVGPAGGLGTEWNQFADEDSAGPLVDSTGAPTTIEFTTDFSEGRAGGAGNTPMLRSTLTDFGRGSTRTLTITGLEEGAAYDIWLTSFRDSTSTIERTYGRWTANNSTTSPTIQSIDNRSGRNGTTFVEGYNFVAFRNVAANGSGVISFTSKGMMTADGADGDYRNGLSGFQIALAAPIVPPEPLEFTDIVRNHETGEVVLTWKSNPGDKYGLYWSADLDGFTMHGVHHAVPAHPTGKRTTLGPITSPLPDADMLFFLVGPPDLSNPVLSQTYGSGNTVTLQFSEPIHPDSVGDLGNFSVTVGGVPIAIQSATLDSSGKNIILTLASSLGAGTNYDVTAQNIATLAGRVIPSSFNGSFQTWDDDPNGVQVFILAGQSNMVGHGKSEDGANPDYNPALPTGPDNLREIPGGPGCLRYMTVNDEDAVAPHYRNLLVDPTQPATSAWKTRTDVKVWWRDSDIGTTRAVIKGDLKIGYSQSRNPGWIGPEYGFGWAVGDHFTDKPVLIIKTAWGGKSLHVDFRPPSAVAARGGVVGPYYTGMIEYVRDCLTNLATEFPAAQHPEFAAVGYRYRIAGIGWHQGWNDRTGPAIYSTDYQPNLVDLIHDLRGEFGNPALPFSITTTGMAAGPAEPYPYTGYTLVEKAQLAVADPSKPVFVENVKATDTRPFWRDASVSPSNFGYHWNHNGESQFLNGKAMGDKTVELLGP